MKYPKAGDLQRETSTQLTSNPCGCPHRNPCVHRNPWEVRSPSGIEGVFAEEDEALAEAADLRKAGVQRVTVDRRDKGTRPRPPRHALQNPADRLFSGITPTGIVYADREQERDGDYMRVAFLPFQSLRLQWAPGNHPAELRELVEADAASIIARRGEAYEVSSSGQTVILGGSARRSSSAPPMYHERQGRPPGVPNPPRVLREKWGDNSEIVVEHNRYGITAWLESKRGGGRLPISFGAEHPDTLREAMELAKKFLRSVHGRNNPGRR